MVIKIRVLESEACGPCAEPAPLPKGPMDHMHTSDCEKPSGYKNAHNGEEARMHRTTLAHLAADVQVLLKMIQDGDDLPEWLEAKITKAGDYMSSAARYIAGNMARDQGQLEEQIDVPTEREGILQSIAQFSDEELALIVQSEPFQVAMASRQELQEGLVGLTEEILVESHFNLYELLQDAVDENGETPCPQCLYEVLSAATCGCPDLIPEAKYRGRTVKLNKPTRGDVKKFKVYVKNAKGNVVKVNFGHGGSSAKKKGEKTMKIRKSNKKARKSFRARHNCKSPGPKWKARYWSCRKW